METQGPNKENNVPPEVHERYQAERTKRLRPDGINQYVDLPADLANPPPAGEVTSRNPELLTQKRHRILIVGAGYGGLLFAVRLLQTTRFSAENITLVDEAGGFGGTWYWNRYPGLVYIESYIYMPLLEETGYMPSRKYVSGIELQEHADRIARHWELISRASFNTSVRSLTWKDDGAFWSVEVLSTSGQPVKLEAEFVITATGLLNTPKIPKTFERQVFNGHMFHASRRDYEYTGGSFACPGMVNLKDTKVGVVGTGATVVQVVPQLAEWSKELVVFQRTPPSIERHENKFTDSTWWDYNFLIRGTDWLKERRENFNAFVSNESPLPSYNEVQDAWTRMQSLSVLIGGPENGDSSFLNEMHESDYRRQEKVRVHVENIVQNRKTAQALKPWYPGWCKRPAFNEDFLKAFNTPNVKLVDTSSKGECQLTPDGLRVGEKEYDVDLIVLCTGYRLGSSFATGRMSITGRSGINLQEKWASGVKTLHGVMTRQFPNLFFPGPFQAGVTVNHVYVLDQLASHVAYIISEAVNTHPESENGETTEKVVLEPSHEAELGWVREVARWAGGFVGMASCTPSYFTFEGAFNADEEHWGVMSSFTTWGRGIRHYVETIETWRRKGELDGIEILTR